MRSHLGCTGSIELGVLSEETRRRLEQVEASWLEYSPDAASLVVRHVQPGDIPALREITGELLEYLSSVSENDRAKIPGGSLQYLDESSGQLIQMKVWPGGFLTVAWARPDYTQAEWQQFRNQPVTVVFEPFQRLNGTVGLQGGPVAAEAIRKVLEGTAGEYSQGDYGIASTIDRVELTLRDVNADVLTLVNTLRYVAKDTPVQGEIDVTSFRTGDLEDYCRFVFRDGETWMARPRLWSEAQTPETDAQPVARAA